LLEGNTRLASESSGLLAISVTDRDKKRAADLANAYTEELRVLTNSLAVTEAAQRRMFYEEQLKRAKEDLIEAEYSFQQIQQKRGLIQLDAQAKVLIAGLAELRAQTAAKQVELQALRSYSTENNPEVRLVENQLASLQQETALVEHRSSSSGSSVAGLQDVAGAGLEYLRAEHEVLYRQTLFDVLIKQYDAAKMDEVKDAAVLQVVESAIPPEQKSSPRRASIVLTFAVLGFVGVCGYLFARDHAKRNPAVSQSLTEFRLALLSK
jgi:capsule polysaccharide export protein KpsE/RkpR